jgi:L-asparaginase/Glu-tRNA(Gln) amidotransferase subunit D
MTTEAAITKLMYALGNSTSLEDAKTLLNQDLAGEISIK